MADRKPEDLDLPNEPIDRLLGPFERFLHVEAASGFVLLAASLIALGFANSPWADWYLGIWKTPVSFGIGDVIGSYSLKHWINDGLVAIFFFVIGLEVKRELVHGVLSDLKTATLPIAAAVGGMVLPATLYLVVLGDAPGARGWGIPMATDIAFVVGCLAVLGPRVPRTLRAMLLSLAIADDIGAILVIALGYTDSLNTTALVWAGVAIALVWCFARLGVRSMIAYTLLGIGVWFGFHESGVHATLAGVILGLMTPAKSYAPDNLLATAFERARTVFHAGMWSNSPKRAAEVRWMRRVVRESVSPLEFLEEALHPWVAFVIMPLFALANAGVPLSSEALGSPIVLAVGVGLVVGKPVGVTIASYLAVRTGLGSLPDGVSYRAIFGGGCLAGIGFTMALFISELALEGAMLNAAKAGVLIASLVAALLGIVILWRASRRAD